MFVYISGKIHKIKSNQIRNIQFINLTKLQTMLMAKIVLKTFNCMEIYQIRLGKEQYTH